MRKKNKLASIKKYIEYILILILLLLIIILIFSTLIRKNKEISENSNDLITWTLEIPDNYNIKESYMFYCDYFIIYYSIESETYNIIINKYDDYKEEAIKAWIFEQLKNFEDGDSITDENTTFKDKMPENLI